MLFESIICGTMALTLVDLQSLTDTYFTVLPTDLKRLLLEFESPVVCCTERELWEWWIDPKSKYNPWSWTHKEKDYRLFRNQYVVYRDLVDRALCIAEVWDGTTHSDGVTSYECAGYGRTWKWFGLWTFNGAVLSHSELMLRFQRLGYKPVNRDVAVLSLRGVFPAYRYTQA
jgi:hypothetical protein